MTLVPSETISIPIGIVVPVSAPPGAAQSVTLYAALSEMPLMGDSVALIAQVGPMAWFEAEPVIGTAPHLVTFADISIGDISSWLWDFGDGSGSDQQNPMHTYTVPGVYTVSLTVTGPNGSDARTRANLVRVEPNLVLLPFVSR